MRAGVRHQLSRRLVLFGALTGGGWDEGALLAGDVGLTVGTEFVFFTARLSVSGTIGGEVVDDGSYEVFCFLCTPHADLRNAPHTAGALETLVGFRLPLTTERSLWLALGAEIVQSVTAVEYHLGAGIGTGLEVVF